MRTVAAFLLTILAGTASSAEPASSPTPREAATAILGEIVELCEKRGMLACEPRFRGQDLLFESIRALESVKASEAKFVEFVRKRYEMPEFTMNDMAAVVKLNMNLTFERASFVQNIIDVERVPGGYDVQMKGTGRILLRSVNGVWVARMPDKEGASDFPFAPLARAAQLKRAMMEYRMLEAEIADYDLDTFARRFVLDLEPLSVAVSQKPELIGKIPDWRPRLEKVMAFYNRFDSVDDMRAAILAEHAPKNRR